MLNRIQSFGQSLGRNVPNLVIAQRVIDRMASAAKHYIEDETGEAMVGLLVPGRHTNGIPTLYVLDTISPDDSAVRQLYTFHQGDERQDDLIWWLQENWRVRRESGRDMLGSILHKKWDVPLRYLGDWHKQPGFMIQPSGGDLMTALDWIDDEDNHTDFLLAPIVTLGHPSTTSTLGGTVNFLTVPQGDGESMRVDFWYIDDNVRAFMPIAPTVYPNDQLPKLSEYPWHLADEKRMDAEHDLLEKDNLFHFLILWNADDAPPLEICFLTARLGADKVLIIVTPWDYPNRPPTARSAPYINIRPEDDIYRLFESLWKQSEPVADPPGWKWSPERHLIDYIHALETSLGLVRPASSAAPAASPAPAVSPAPSAPTASPAPSTSTDGK